MKKADVLAGAGLGEKGVEGIISTSDGLITGHLERKHKQFIGWHYFPSKFRAEEIQE